jgi:hypothetical protein
MYASSAKLGTSPQQNILAYHVLQSSTNIYLFIYLKNQNQLEA